MPRVGLTREKVIAEATVIADEVGLGALTLASVAERVGVRLPSLYKHVAGLPDLRRELALRARRELAGVVREATAGRVRADALIGLADGYRDWARRRPSGYEASLVAPAPGDAEDQQAGELVTAAVYDALAGYGLDQVRLIDAVRTVRALLHGYLALERAGGFGLDRPAQESLRWAVSALDRELGEAGP